MDITEPILEDDEIQGNILAGFNKPFQKLISVEFPNDIQQVKIWLSQLEITSLAQIMAFRERFRAFKGYDLNANESIPKSIWLNIAFTYPGLLKLTATANYFTDNIFKAGLGKASARLKDPTEPDQPGNQKNWLFGGIGKEPDVLLILAADAEDDINQEAEELIKKAEGFQIRCLHVDHGHDLGVFGKNDEEKEHLRATEHFGFKDGISHPGVRGLLRSQKEFLTNRKLPAPTDPIEIAYSVGGQPLIFPGEFVLGYVRQSDSSGQVATTAYPIGSQEGAIAPEWARNGSFLVYRRLRQDVKAFNDFIQKECISLNQQKCPMSEKKLGAYVVGRWPNGAPLMSFPDQEPLKYDMKSEDFRFEDDMFSRLCPASAHIRKVNPRGLTTEQGGPQKTLVHRTLRRGIPFGKLYSDEPGGERGLLFISYQCSIGEQFEFLQKNWANHYKNPHAMMSDAGHDLIIGQTMKKTEERNRHMAFLYRDQIFKMDTKDVTIKDWVIPTGGGYFFSPSISAIKTILCKLD